VVDKLMWVKPHGINAIEILWKEPEEDTLDVKIVVDIELGSVDVNIKGGPFSSHVDVWKLGEELTDAWKSLITDLEKLKTDVRFEGSVEGSIDLGWALDINVEHTEVIVKSIDIIVIVSGRSISGTTNASISETSNILAPDITADTSAWEAMLKEFCALSSNSASSWVYWLVNAINNTFHNVSWVTVNDVTSIWNHTGMHKLFGVNWIKCLSGSFNDFSTKAAFEELVTESTNREWINPATNPITVGDSDKWNFTGNFTFLDLLLKTWNENCITDFIMSMVNDWVKKWDIRELSKIESPIEPVWMELNRDETAITGNSSRWKSRSDRVREWKDIEWEGDNLSGMDKSAGMDRVPASVVLNHWGFIPNTTAVNLSEFLTIHEGIIDELVVETGNENTGTGSSNFNIWTTDSSTTGGCKSSALKVIAGSTIINALVRSKTESGTVNSIWIIDNLESIFASHKIVKLLHSVTEEHVMNENIITGVGEKLVGIRTWIELNFLNDSWNKIPMPSTEIHMALIGHAVNTTGILTSANGFIHDTGSINFWKNNTAVVTTNEINDSHKVKLPLDSSSLSLNGSVNDSPWNWNSSWASKVKWEVPNVIKFLGINPTVNDSISELLWDHLPVEDRNEFFKILGIMDELSETRYKTVCHGIVVINDDICEGS
jgi:hypothetical protein